jgi:hypothetical protein
VFTAVIVNITYNLRKHVSIWEMAGNLFDLDQGV